MIRFAIEPTAEIIDSQLTNDRCCYRYAKFDTLGPTFWQIEHLIEIVLSEFATNTRMCVISLRNKIKD